MHRIILGVALIACSPLALAQDGGSDDRRPRGTREQDGDGRMGGERRGGDRQFRGDGRMGMGGPRGGEWMQRMFERTAEDLDLDEAQRQEFDRLAQPHLDRMREMGERWAEVREAQDAGDEARARQLREQLQRGANPADALNEILGSLEPMLRPEQIDKADAIRDRMQGDSDNRDRMRRISRELPELLALDETQKQHFDELIARSREEMGNRMSSMGPLFEQMREAREAGDTARLRELERQMESQRPDMNARYAEFFAQLEPILRDDQKALLADFRDEIGLASDGAPADKGGATDVRTILQMAKRLSLDAQQRRELKEIEEDAMRAWREVGRDKEARADLARQVREEISKMLDESQQTRFAQLLQRLSRKSPRG